MPKKLRQIQAAIAAKRSLTHGKHEQVPAKNPPATTFRSDDAVSLVDTVKETLRDVPESAQ